MADVNVIVFSMNRAMQLELLLYSMQKFTRALWPPKVMRKTTLPRADEAYEIVARSYPTVRWTDQAEFKEKLIAQIDPQVPYTCLLCDDDVFFRQMPLVPAIAPGTCWSLRFGEESGYTVTPSRGIMGGYSIDGNIHRTNEYLCAIGSAQFDCPNRLEEQLNWGPLHKPVREMYGQYRCLVGIPHNKVQTTHPDNRDMGGSAQELQNRFMAGQRILLERMDFSGVRSCHWDVNYMFG